MATVGTLQDDVQQYEPCRMTCPQYDVTGPVLAETTVMWSPAVVQNNAPDLSGTSGVAVPDGGSGQQNAAGDIMTLPQGSFPSAGGGGTGVGPSTDTFTLPFPGFPSFPLSDAGVTPGKGSTPTPLALASNLASFSGTDVVRKKRSVPNTTGQRCYPTAETVLERGGGGVGWGGEGGRGEEEDFSQVVVRCCCHGDQHT